MNDIHEDGSVELHQHWETIHWYISCSELDLPYVGGA